MFVRLNYKKADLAGKLTIKGEEFSLNVNHIASVGTKNDSKHGTATFILMVNGNDYGPLWQTYEEIAELLDAEEVDYT